MADERKKVEKLLKSHPSLKITTKEGKYRVVCEFTSHEISCNLKEVETYINGKKYKYECENRLTSKEQELSSQYLILKPRGQFYCTLTKRYLNNLPHHIKLHLKGKRFQKFLANKAKDSTFPDKNTSKHKEEPTQCDGDAEMWIPSDSESETAKNDVPGSDFELDRKTEKKGCSVDMKLSSESTKPIVLKVKRSEHKNTRKRSSKNELSKSDVLKPEQRKKRKKLQ